MLLKIPHTAGQILEREMAAGNVEENRRHLDMLLTAWIDAREYDKAVEIIDKLGTMTGDSKYFMRKASIHNELGEWQDVAVAAEQAINAGIDDPTAAHMLAGTALAELGRYQGRADRFRSGEGVRRFQANARMLMRGLLLSRKRFSCSPHSAARQESGASRSAPEQSNCDDYQEQSEGDAQGTRREGVREPRAQRRAQGRSWAR